MKIYRQKQEIVKDMKQYKLYPKRPFPEKQEQNIHYTLGDIWSFRKLGNCS